MKAFITFAAVLAASFSSLLSCFPSNTSAESGKVFEKEYTFGYFNEIKVGSAFEVNLVKGDTYRVYVSVPEAFEKSLVVKVNGEELTVRMKDGFNVRKFSFRDLKFKATVTVPEFKEIELSGASELFCNDTFNGSEVYVGCSGASHVEKLCLNCNSLDIECSGASRVRIEANCHEADVECSGASKVILEGSADKFEIECSGASSCDAEKFEAHRVSVDNSGASSSTVFALEAMKVELSGASTCRYRAGVNTNLNVIEISGASSLKRID